MQNIEFTPFELKLVSILDNLKVSQEEIEKLAKSNVAIIKAYYETLKRENVDIVEEFIQDADDAAQAVEETEIKSKEKPLE